MITATPLLIFFYLCDCALLGSLFGILIGKLIVLRLKRRNKR